ncbi:MAG: TrmB family transcriptional regulator [Nanoarchaeota archaeon]
MDESDVVATLSDACFSQKEATTYVTLLKMGSTTPAKLSQRTGIGRVSTYHILDAMVLKGAVSCFQKGGKKHYSAMDPDKIKAILQHKQKRIESVTPYLHELQHSMPSKMKVSVFEGRQGIFELFSDILESKETIFVYGNREVGEKVIHFESLNFRKKRVQAKIKLYGLSNSIEAQFMREKEWQKQSEFRILDELEEVSTWTFIYGSKVAILAFERELMGIIIDNADAANTQKFMFNIMWEKAEKLY